MTGEAAKPATLGRIVHYKLSTDDVAAIESRRGEDGRGNRLEAGQNYPAIVVRTWGETPGSAVQLQVFLDGPDTYWATSRVEGHAPGQWFWPPRV